MNRDKNAANRRRIKSGIRQTKRFSAAEKTTEAGMKQVDEHLGPADIHLWTISLDVAPSVLNVFEGILSQSELERSRRFRLPQHQNWFIAGRGFMRILLSRYLQTEPAKLQFAYGRYGKPTLSGAFEKSHLHFNLAHSENVAIFVITRVGIIGVDIERIRALSDADELADRFFSARESAKFHEAPVEQKPHAFLNLWTRKEAWLKAVGEGIGHLLKTVEVTFLPGEPARFLALPGNLHSNGSWILHELDPMPGFVAALAIETRLMSLRCYSWDSEASGQMINATFRSQEAFPRATNFNLIEGVPQVRA